MKATLSPAARRQLDDIFLYISRDDPLAAARVLARIFEVADFLARFPRSGQRTVISGVRAMPVTRYPYVIYFRRSSDGVRILRVLHAARKRPELREEGAGYRMDLAPVR